MTANPMDPEKPGDRADDDPTLRRHLQEIERADDLGSLEGLRVKLLGRKGHIADMYRGLKGLEGDEKKRRGQTINLFRDKINQASAAKKRHLESVRLEGALADDGVDWTLPVGLAATGKLHVVHQTIDELVAIFGAMGFAVAEGPDIEDDFHNFTALNFPVGHPARDMHDTFFLPGEKEDGVLRTHTSPVQIRTMRSKPPPIRIIAPGRCYRSDSDATHTPMFHQVEGLLVDDRTDMAELKGCLVKFIGEYFDMPDMPVRFRPSFFPFTEPSAEMDVACRRENNRLILGEGDDWLEILGCGMVHENVLTNAGVDTEKWRGFAFGLGIERIAMLKYGIHDLRLFYESGGDWLKHYGFSPFFSANLATGLTEPK